MDFRTNGSILAGYHWIQMFSHFLVTRWKSTIVSFQPILCTCVFADTAEIIPRPCVPGWSWSLQWSGQREVGGSFVRSGKPSLSGPSVWLICPMPWLSVVQQRCVIFRSSPCRLPCRRWFSKQTTSGLSILQPPSSSSFNVRSNKHFDIEPIGQPDLTRILVV